MSLEGDGFGGRVHVLNHALFTDALAVLRDRSSSRESFVVASRLCGQILALEALRHLPLRERDVAGPLDVVSVQSVKEPPVFIPILRSGLALLEAFRSWVPGASVGFVGEERDEKTAEARTYYAKLPELQGKDVFVLDPMCATGGSAVGALSQARDGQPGSLHFVCLIASSEGIDRLARAFPKVQFTVGAIDPGLDDRCFIRPGLGDFGDRFMGTDSAVNG